MPPEEVNDPCKSNSNNSNNEQAQQDAPKFHLKIADFGFARHLHTAALADTLCGSPLYMAPEILQHQRYDAKADLWSTGTVLFEMLTGRPPFGGANHMDLLRNIQRRAVRLPSDVCVSGECVRLLRALLHRNPMRRAGFGEFFEACGAFVGLGCLGPPVDDDSDDDDDSCCAANPAEDNAVSSSSGGGTSLVRCGAGSRNSGAGGAVLQSIRPSSSSSR